MCGPLSTGMHQAFFHRIPFALSFLLHLRALSGPQLLFLLFAPPEPLLLLAPSALSPAPVAPLELSSPRASCALLSSSCASCALFSSCASCALLSSSFFLSCSLSSLCSKPGGSSLVSSSSSVSCLLLPFLHLPHSQPISSLASLSFLGPTWPGGVSHQPHVRRHSAPLPFLVLFLLLHHLDQHPHIFSVVLLNFIHHQVLDLLCSFPPLPVPLPFLLVSSARHLTSHPRTRPEVPLSVRTSANLPVTSRSSVVSASSPSIDLLDRNALACFALVLNSALVIPVAFVRAPPVAVALPLTAHFALPCLAAVALPCPAAVALALVDLLFSLLPPPI